jgi:hypothetical protein
MKTKFKRDGIDLSERDLSLINTLMTKLAKFEYEYYLTKKKENSACQLERKQDIGTIYSLVTSSKVAA